MKKIRVCVIGLGIFGKRTATSLAERGVSVLVVDKDRDLVEAMKDQVDQALILDTTDELALDEVRVGEMDMVVCAIGSQHTEDSIMTTALLHKLGVQRIIARAENSLHARILRQVGANEVINPEEAMAERLAFRVSSPRIREILPLAKDVVVAEVPVPGHFIGKTLRDLEVRRKYNINVIGVRRPPTEEVGEPTEDKEVITEDSRTLVLNFSPNDKFSASDQLVLIGREQDVQKLSMID